MSEKRTTARAFHGAVGVEDWRVLFSGAHAYFHVGSFAEKQRGSWPRSPKLRRSWATSPTWTCDPRESPYGPPPGTLVLHGDHDFVPLEIARRIADAVPGSRMVGLPACGHFAYLEQPEAVHRAIAELPA